MPPKRRKPIIQQPCTSKQALERDKIQQRQPSVKEMLKSKRLQKENEEYEDDGLVQMIPYLRVHNDISRPGYDFISIQARVWFRDHSNIDDILQRYIKMKKIAYPNIDSFLNQMIRAVMSTYNSRRYYPFNKFKFNSLKEEIIGKELLMHPRISTPEDLKDTLTFYKENDIKPLLIDISMNNDLHNVATKFLEKKRNKHGSRKLINYCSEAMNAAMEHHYRKSGTQKLYELQSITVEQFCKIASFERAVRKDMELNKIDADQMDFCKLQKLLFYRKHPQAVYEDKYLDFLPNYALIISNITPAQAKIISRKKDQFYERTNASTCLLHNKRYYESDNPDNEQREADRKTQFFLDYIRAENKRVPPFNYLLWIEEEEHQDEEAETTQIRTESRNNQISSSCEINPPLLQHLTEIDPKIKPTIEELSIDPGIFNDREAEIMRYLFLDQSLIRHLKQHLRQEYPDSFDNYWSTRKKFIVFNILIKAIREENLILDQFVKHCSPATQSKINELYEIRAPTATSTQNVEEDLFYPARTSPSPSTELPKEPARSAASTSTPIRQRPLQINEDDLREVFPTIRPIKTPVKVAEKPHEEVETTVIIKQEKSVSQKSQGTNDSSCILLSQDPRANVIEIVDSDDDTQRKLVKELGGEDRIIDKYQRNMDKDSQELGLVSQNVAADTDEVLVPQSEPVGTVQETDRVSGELDDAEREEACAQAENSTRLLRKRIAKEQQEPTFGAKKSRRTRRGLEFLSDTIGEKRDETHFDEYDSLDLNANFSIFLSTQVMLDHDRNIKEPTAMTFTNPRKASTEDFGKTCFLSELVQVIFKKDSMFEIIITAPQYSLNHISIKDENIKEALNFNDMEWITLMNNLNQLESYQFSSSSENRRQSMQNQFERQITQHLDFYFSSLPKFRNFQLRTLDGHSYEIQSTTLSSRATDLTDALSENLLERIKALK